MEIRFKTTKLERCYLKHRQAVRAWGRDVAERFAKAMEIIKAVESVEELGAFPQLHYHSLTGDRRGQHSVRLGRRTRLIFTLEGDGTIARIEEVSRHYGD